MDALVGRVLEFEVKPPNELVEKRHNDEKTLDVRWKFFSVKTSQVGVERFLGQNLSGEGREVTDSLGLGCVCGHKMRINGPNTSYGSEI